MSKCLKILVCAVAVFSFASGLVCADIIAYDGFGTSGNLDGSNSSGYSNGFADVWKVADDSSVYTLSSGSISLPSNIHAASGGSVNLISYAEVKATRALSTSLSTTSGDTWYVGFVTDTYNSVLPYTRMGLCCQSVDDGGDIRDDLWIGFGNRNSSSQRQHYAIIQSKTAGYYDQQIASTSMADRGSIFYYALKIVTSTDGTLDVYTSYYNLTDSESIPTTEPTSWDMHITSSLTTGNEQVELQLSNVMVSSRSRSTTGNTEVFDEFIISTTWGEIASVPEPSTIALLATGLIGLLAYAWRKRK